MREVYTPLRSQHSPGLPKRLRSGNYDAVAFAHASLARKLIQDRKGAGLSQADLAHLTKIPVGTLARIETFELAPSITIVGKIDRAIAKAGTK